MDELENKAPESTLDLCITSAPKPKSLGQVGYEAMLSRMRAQAEKAGQLWTSDPRLWESVGAWENQPPKLREDWEAIGEAIAKEVSPTLYHECLRLKREQKAVQP